MTAILETNRGAADYAWAQPHIVRDVPSIRITEAPTWIREQDPFIVDVREPSEYLAGHLPGAVSIPQADLALRLSELPKERTILIVCAAGSRSLRAAHYLRYLGYQQVVNLEGGTLGWIQAGHLIESEPEPDLSRRASPAVGTEPADC